MVRTFKIINIPDPEAPAPSTSGNGRVQNQTGPLLSARLCDLDVVWQRASQLCDMSVQVRPGKCRQAVCVAMCVAVFCVAHLLPMGCVPRQCAACGVCAIC